MLKYIFLLDSHFHLTNRWDFSRIGTFGTNQEHFSAVQHQILRCSMTPTVGITDTPPWELQTLPRELELDPTEGIMYKRIINPHRGN